MKAYVIMYDGYFGPTNTDLDYLRMLANTIPKVRIFPVFVDTEEGQEYDTITDEEFEKRQKVKRDNGREDK